MKLKQYAPTNRVSEAEALQFQLIRAVMARHGREAIWPPAAEHLRQMSELCVPRPSRRDLEISRLRQKRYPHTHPVIATTNFLTD